jgi:ferredoxin
MDIDKNTTRDFFHSEESWQKTLEALLPLIHPVDQDATRIWFAFWPLRLHHILNQSEDLDQRVQTLEMEGRYWLKEQLDSSLHLLFAFQYWPAVKAAVRSFAESLTSCDQSLESQIREVAKTLASDLKIPESHLIGITAGAFMALQQIGLPALATASTEASVKRSSPERFLRAQLKKRGRLFSFLKTVNSKHAIVFDERNKKCCFKAINGQDISMAAGMDRRDYLSADPRCSEGPIPFQCRTGTCGSCWIGVLRGKEKLSPVSEFEKTRLEYFGYNFGISKCESHPPIRLSCQAKCYGDVSIAIPPWNGVLNVLRSDR